MRALFGLIFAFIFLLSCVKNEPTPGIADLEGEWRYVGTFDNRADPLFSKEDFDKSIYKIRMSNDLSFTSEINYMRGLGQLKLSDPIFENNSINAKAVIDGYREINKPVETEADGVFRNKLLNTIQLGYNKISKAEFDTMKFQFDANQFILFARQN